MNIMLRKAKEDRTEADKSNRLLKLSSYEVMVAWSWMVIDQVMRMIKSWKYFERLGFCS